MYAELQAMSLESATSLMSNEEVMIKDLPIDFYAYIVVGHHRAKLRSCPIWTQLLVTSTRRCGPSPWTPGAVWPISLRILDMLPPMINIEIQISINLGN